MKKKYLNDVAVLLIFFCRYEQTKEVFEAIKEARPSRLYLYQDAPRDGREDDLKGVMACRELVSDQNIDWECEVHRFYQEKNMGCDPSEYIAQKWMFATEEMGIVLEDDDVPSQSFFPFCKELLEKYKDDERINIICGMNNNDISEYIKESYLFTQKGSIWGWASWRRVIDTWDGKYTWVYDPEKLEIIKKNCDGYDFDNWMKIVQYHISTGKEHYESILAASMFLFNRVNIVPKYNMIKNIGVSEVTTHSTNDIRLLSTRSRKLMYKKTYNIEFPLIHPESVKRDYKYEKIMTPSKIGILYDHIEVCFRCLIYQGPTVFIKKILRKLGL